MTFKVEGGLMSAKEFCDCRDAVQHALVQEFRKATEAALPKTAFEWEAAFEHFVQVMAYQAAAAGDENA
jgi:hypothetical protein